MTRLRYTDLDHVVVTARARGFDNKLHAFIRLTNTDGEFHWRLFTPQTAKQRAAYEQQRHIIDEQLRKQVDGEGGADLNNTDRYAWHREESERIHRALSPSSGDVGNNDVLGTARVDLGDGVTPHGSTLAVVLEALHAHHQSNVDRDDLKVVLSQLGSRITNFTTLPEQQRELARAALYSQIVARCSTLERG